MRTTYVVTGASRGIGLTIVEDLVRRQSALCLQASSLHGSYQVKYEANYVIAAVRDRSAQSMQDLRAKYSVDRFQIVHLDLADPSSIRSAAAHANDCLTGSLDYLIHCAGVSLEDLTPFENV